jgi:glycosyltransferase involved in cell wall biosynthesis
LLVDPVDVEAIADAIERVCSDEQGRAQMSSQGKIRASMFQWEPCARAMRDIYYESSK